jgi:alpha-beta hydrolase superfamily lysophospholipase
MRAVRLITLGLAVLIGGGALFCYIRNVLTPSPYPVAATMLPHLEDNVAVMSDGIRLPMRRWLAQDPVAIIVAVHGHNDYSAAWETFGPAPFLAQHRISVYAYDQRGYGAAPVRGYWAGGDRVPGDLVAIVKLVREANPGKPIYILGHSMGGAVTMAAMERSDAPTVDGIILAAPAMLTWDNVGWGRRILVQLMAFVAPDAVRERDGSVHNTDNPALTDARMNDPLVSKTTRFGNIPAMIGMTTRAADAAATIKVPVFYIYGTNDETVPKAATAEVVAKLRQGHMPLRVACYANGYHEILQGMNRELIWNDMLAWLGDRNAPLPSHSDGDLAPCGL